MGIYIKNMKMPKSCDNCRFCGLGGLRNERVVCMFTGANAYMNTVQYLDDCPLVEIPPHGRLIDADALIDKVIAKYLKFEREGKLVFAAVEIKQDICDLISDAPTIIPAEPEEEEMK